MSLFINKRNENKEFRLSNCVVICSIAGPFDKQLDQNRLIFQRPGLADKEQRERARGYISNFPFNLKRIFSVEAFCTLHKVCTFERNHIVCCTHGIIFTVRDLKGSWYYLLGLCNWGSGQEKGSRVFYDYCSLPFSLYRPLSILNFVALRGRIKLPTLNYDL